MRFLPDGQVRLCTKLEGGTPMDSDTPFPRIVKQRLNISPLIIIASLVFWGWVLGMRGAILAVPLTLTMKQVLRQAASGSNPAPPPVQPPAKA